MKFKQFLVIGAMLAVQAHASERLISYDLGSIDTLRVLQATDQLVGLPKQALPQYLSEFSEAQYSDVGGLKTPNTEAVAEADPSLIFITARQREQGAALKEIAPTEMVGLVEGDYWPAFEEHVMKVASHVEKQNEARAALGALKADLRQMKDQVADQQVLMVTHNAGGFGVLHDPVAFELLGLDQVQLPDTVKPVKHGTRVFMPLTVDDIVTSNPKVLYVVDRSQAIGQTDKALDVDALQSQLKQLGSDTKVAYLTPGLWYLSGNGLESVKLQAQELTQAL